MRPLSQCTASCGGGFQKRTVHCVSSEDNKTEDQDQCLCDHEPRPPEFQKCNRQACRKSDGGWMSLLRGRRLFINKLSSTTEFVDSFSPLCWAGILMLKRPTSSPGSKLPDLVRFDSNSLRGYLIHFPFSKSVHTDVIPHRWESHLFIQTSERCSSLSQEPSQVLNGPPYPASFTVSGQVAQKQTLRCKFMCKGFSKEVLPGKSIKGMEEARRKRKVAWPGCHLRHSPSFSLVPQGSSRV